MEACLQMTTRETQVLAGDEGGGRKLQYVRGKNLCRRQVAGVFRDQM